MMVEYYFDDNGVVMAKRHAGGTGGGVTSWIVERATSDEAAMYREWYKQNEETQAQTALIDEPVAPVAQEEPPLDVPHAE